MATQAATSQIYVWRGTDKRGKKTKGEITGTTTANAKALLRKQGIVSATVRKKPKPLFGERKKAIKPADIAIFARQLATMVKAGVPLVQSFDIVAEGVDNPSMRNLVMDIKTDVAGGSSLAGSLAKSRNISMICFVIWLRPVNNLAR